MRGCKAKGLFIATLFWGFIFIVSVYGDKSVNLTGPGNRGFRSQSNYFFILF